MENGKRNAALYLLTIEKLPNGYKKGKKITGAALQQCGLVIPEALQEYQAWQIHIVEVL